MPTNPKTDTAILEWLQRNLEWDGYGYFLPEICIREREWGQEFCPQPTLDELRQVFCALMESGQQR